MNEKRQRARYIAPLRSVEPQRMGFYVEHPAGGCSDIGVLQLSPGIGLYHHEHIRMAMAAEREHVIPYLLSVLEVLRK